jgi:HAD superfamily hydrolase (TIGR01509 family)
MAKNKQKIALLDLGGVVFQSTGSSNDVVRWNIISVLNHKYGYDLNVGKVSLEVFLEEYNALTNQKLTGTAFLEAVFDTLAINEELIELIRHDHKIVIVSDNYQENIEYISKRYDFSSWSIQQIYSYEYKMVKADPDFFRKLIEDLKDYDIKQMVFIDDSQPKLDSAIKQGIRGILYKNNEQLKAALYR